MEKPFDVISNEPLELEMTSPLHVAENPNMPSRPEYHDFIAGEGQAKEQELRPVVPPKVVFTEAVEYRSGPDHKKVQKQRDRKVLELAKHIFHSKDEELTKFNQCLKIAQSATDEQRANPTSQLTEAMIVIDRGRPMTKARALERARKEVQGREPVIDLMASGDE